MEYRRINELCTTITSNIQINKLEDNNGIYPLYGASGLVKNIDFFKIDKPYVSIVKDGSGVGKIEFHEAKSSIVGTMQAFINNDDVDIRYLYYVLKNQKLDKSKTGAAIPHIYFKDYGKNLVKFYTMDKQLEIVSNLDKINSLIETNKKQLELLNELIKSRFIEMFGNPDSNSLNLPLKRFDSICENLDSRRKPITSSERVEGVYPYYGASGIVDYVDGYIFDENILLISEDGANLLTRSTPIAFSASGKVWVNNHAHVVRFTNFATQKYIEYYFSLIDISEHITGSAQPKFNQAKLNAMMIPMPELGKQMLFMEFIKLIDKSKFIIQQQIKSLQELLDKKMDEYFGD